MARRKASGELDKDWPLYTPWTISANDAVEKGNHTIDDENLLIRI